LLQNPVLEPVFQNLPLFINKKVVGNYFGFAQKCKHRMGLPAEQFKKEISMFRVNEYGFETKEAMNVIKVLRLTNELMTTGQVNLLRHDACELLEIKQGLVPKADVEKMIDELLLENKSLFKADNLLSRSYDFDQVHTFVRDYRKFVYSELGMI